MKITSKEIKNSRKTSIKNFSMISYDLKLLLQNAVNQLSVSVRF